MAPSHQELRLLLIQARNAPKMELQEQQCFLERCKIDRAQLVTANIAHDAIHPGLLEGVDAMMIGGAGEYSATKDYPWMDDLLHVVRVAHEAALPSFGCCWGHQIMARALGGKVIYDNSRAELGCHPVTLTEAGLQDRLFKDFPASFLTNMGHHDRVVELPPDGIALAFSETQPNQAFRMAGKPMYGTQFHSELDAQRERERLIEYRAYYLRELPTEEAFQATLDSLAETTEVDHLLYDFLQKYAVQH